MGEYLYHAVRILGRPFAYRCLGLENIHGSGPAIYTANHLGATGPIAVILSLPVRLYPWARAENTDLARAPLYLYDDFVHPTLHVNGRAGLALAAAIARLAVPLINGLGAIPMEGSERQHVAAFRRSLALLSEGKNVLIFPEDRDLPPDAETGIHGFRCGFSQLCAMFERTTGRRLPVYPMAVSSARRVVLIGQALFLQPHGRRRDGIERLREQLQEEVGRLYRACSLKGGSATGSLAPPTPPAPGRS